MALEPGSRLGPYTITASIGAGGMGEVYKSTDTRLDRTVAVKVLPQHVASDPELKQRFELEAKTLAALVHPHICSVFDVGSQHGVDFLVMEYLEGETLEQRLTKGPLPLDQALQLGIQTADALAAAHRAGIMHRDLKPGNIMLTKTGARLLDFGLAKTSAPAVAGNLSLLPTTPPNLTVAGAVLGTFQYMAPEQVEGQEADARTDIFAFGAMLYEAVTGRRAFVGKSHASLIGAILKDVPLPLSTLQPLSPPPLDRIVAKCLAKEPDARWQSAADLRDELQWVAQSPPPPKTEAAGAGGNRFAWTVAGVSLVIAALTVVAGLYAGRAPATTGAAEMRVEVTMPGRFEEWVAISPDGRMLVAGGLADKKWQLWLRPLDSLNARPLEGTEGAIYPFWSPDSKSIGFFAEGKLKKVDIAGGPAQTLANAREPRGGAWGPDGTIIFTPALFGGLYRVSERGGEATPLTQLQSGQRSHRFPCFLPDGRRFLYFTTNAGAYVGSLDGAAPKRLTLNSDSAAIFAQPGVLLFLRERTLMAQPFSAETLETTGNAVQVAEIAGVSGATNTGTLPVSAATNGAIAFRAASGVQTGGLRLAWFDRSGKEVGDVGSIERGYMFDAELSPSGTRVAVSRNPSARVGQFDIWLIETARGIATRLTSDTSTDQFPVWSPDEQQLIFGSNRKGTFDLYEVPTDGSASEKLLHELPGTTVPTNWSSDGRFVLYNELSTTTGYDLWALPLFGDRKPIQIANREFDELGGQLARDRRWVAYESNETDRFEIVVQQFPNATGKWQISSGGGMMPRWRADGKELFYVASDGTLMGVPITVASDGKTLQPGAPLPLVGNRIVFDAYRGVRSGRYSVTADGQRFLMVVPAEEAVAPVVVFLNWAGGVLK